MIVVLWRGLPVIAEAMMWFTHVMCVFVCMYAGFTSFVGHDRYVDLSAGDSRIRLSSSIAASPVIGRRF